MRKKFKDSKIFKLIKTIAPVLPFNIGSIASELMSNTETPEGTMTREKAVMHSLKLMIYAVLLYLVITGKLTMSDAEEMQ